MKMILLKYLSIYFFFHNQVCVITKRIPSEDAQKRCLHSTRVTASDANLFIVEPMLVPTTEYQRCFLQCYFAYANKIVVATLGKKREGYLSGFKTPVNETLVVVIRNKKPLSVKRCVELAKEKERSSGQKCAIGGITRSCHIDYAKELATSMNLEIQDDKSTWIFDTPPEVKTYEASDVQEPLQDFR